jgi:hypothetical protein
MACNLMLAHDEMYYSTGTTKKNLVKKKAIMKNTGTIVAPFFSFL